MLLLDDLQFVVHKVVHCNAMGTHSFRFISSKTLGLQNIFLLPFCV